MLCLISVYITYSKCLFISFNKSFWPILTVSFYRSLIYIYANIYIFTLCWKLNRKAISVSWRFVLLSYKNVYLLP